MVPGEPIDGATTWRDDDRAQRIVVETGPAWDAVAVGVNVALTGAGVGVAVNSVDGGTRGTATASAIAGIFKAPFDILADKLRGYIGLTMDMQTQPEKVLKALGKI